LRRIRASIFAIASVALAAMPALTIPAHGEDYPSRRITLIAPWPPAGAIDTLCRELAPGVSDLLGQPVVVENRPGEGSIRPEQHSHINILRMTYPQLGTA
jgi:tripartite-type tricarboxylate transporter receptor subunit TctC